MKVELLTLCMAGRPGMGGELNILGATDHLLVPQVPTALNCNVVARIRFEKMDEGLKEIKFLFVDSDGKHVNRPLPPQKINVKVPSGESTVGANIVFGIPNVQITSTGEYEIGLAVNERLEMSVPVYVRLIAPLQRGSSPSAAR